MSEEYTPTTDVIRDGFSWVPDEETDFLGRRAYFDRWLATHDAEVARRAAVKALREAAEATSDEDSIIDIALGGAAFVGDWLRARAARLEGAGHDN